MALNEQEIKRKALAGIALTNPSSEASELYNKYKNSATSSSGYETTKQGITGQVQYPTGITNRPTSSNIQLSQSMLDEIKRKADTGTPLTNWSAQKQELYNGYTNPAPTYNDFTYNDAPTYDSKYQSQIDSALEQLLAATGNFSYDYKTDPLYAQYKESYQREGDRAMTNSMAQATALSGGRMNSAAMVAGQQSQNYYNQQLNDKIPELQQQAYAQYVQGLLDQRNNIGTMQGLENMMFGQYQTSLDQYNTDRNMAYQVNSDKNNYNYQNYRDQQAYLRNVLESDRNYDYNLWNAQNALAQDERNYNYQVGRDQVSDSQWNKTFDRNVLESDRNYNYNASQDAIKNNQWQQNFDRGVYEYDNNFNYNKEQDAITNALNQFKANQSASSSSSKGLSYTNRYNSLKSMLNEKDSISGKNTYTKDQVEDQIAQLLVNGQISEEEATSLYKDLGLW